MGEPVFEIAPEPLDGIEFRCVRRKKHQADIGGQPQRLGFVKGPVVQQEQMEASGSQSGEVIEEELKALSIQERQFQKEALSRQWFDCPVQVETLEAIRRR
jgi:hypothetical protein